MQLDPSHSADIVNYYYTNYTNCSKNHSFLASWQFISLFTHSVLIIQIPLIIFTGYCILQKTPKAMGSLKWAMLNVHFWSSLMDILLCSLVTPYIFFPTLSGFSIGLFNYLGMPVAIQALIGFVSVGFMFNSIAALFENRSSSFEMNWFRFKSTVGRFVFFTLNAIIYTCFLLPIFINIPNQDAAKFKALKKLVCPTEEFFSSPIFILITTPFLGFYLITVFFTQWLWTMFSIIFFITCITYYIYFVTRHFTSLKTQRLQRMFFVGNLVQIAIPSVFWAIPCTLLVLSYLNAYYNQVFNNLGIAFVSLHGIASMIATIFIHAPYRNFVYRVLGKVKIASRSDSLSSVL